MRKWLLPLLLAACLLLSGCSSPSSSSSSGTSDASQLDGAAPTETAPSGEADAPREAETKTERLSFDGIGGAADIQYPAFAGFGDRTEAVNELVRSALIDNYTLYVSPAELKDAGFSQANLTVEGYRVKLLNRRIVSIVYDAYFYAEDAAHPVTLRFATNLDLEALRELRVAELVQDVDALRKAFAGERFTYVEEDGPLPYDELLEFVSFEEINGYFLQEEPQVYLTGAAVGLLVELPQSIGGSISFELPYEQAPFVSLQAGDAVASADA